MTALVAVDIELALTCRTAWRVGTGFGLGQILDDRTVAGRHPSGVDRVERPYVPGASLKGRLRYEATRLASDLQLSDSAELLRALFGDETDAGRLTFYDAHLALDQLQRDGGLGAAYFREFRNGVALSRVRRVARDNLLLRVETGTASVLSARIAGYVPEAAGLRAVAVLAFAARTLTHVGGDKARGLGALTVTLARLRYDQEDLSSDLGRLGEALR